MNAELTTMNDDDAASRHVMAMWTNSLLRQRARPVGHPPRGESWFKAAPVRSSAMDRPGRLGSYAAPALLGAAA
jgi:hypothetical protein